MFHTQSLFGPFAGPQVTFGNVSFSTAVFPGMFGMQFVRTNQLSLVIVTNGCHNQTTEHASSSPSTAQSANDSRADPTSTATSAILADDALVRHFCPVFPAAAVAMIPLYINNRLVT